MVGGVAMMAKTKVFSGRGYMYICLELARTMSGAGGVCTVSTSKFQLSMQRSMSVNWFAINLSIKSVGYLLAKVAGKRIIVDLAVLYKVGPNANWVDKKSAATRSSAIRM